MVKPANSNDSINTNRLMMRMGNNNETRINNKNQNTKQERLQQEQDEQNTTIRTTTTATTIMRMKRKDEDEEDGKRDDDNNNAYLEEDDDMEDWNDEAWRVSRRSRPSFLRIGEVEYVKSEGRHDVRVLRRRGLSDSEMNTTTTADSDAGSAGAGGGGTAGSLRNSNTKKFKNLFHTSTLYHKEEPWQHRDSYYDEENWEQTIREIRNFSTGILWLLVMRGIIFRCLSRFNPRNQRNGRGVGSSGGGGNGGRGGSSTSTRRGGRGSGGGQRS